jgi:hypothetical protein
MHLQTLAISSIDFGTKRALIIAISHYQNERLSSLPFCENDGKAMCKILSSPSVGYKLPDNNRLIGKVDASLMRDRIIDFFNDPKIKSQDTLLFYYSGHGVPDIDGDVYLATSEIDPNVPNKRGFSYYELTKMMSRTLSTQVITILDCCYSGAAKVSKGNENDAALKGSTAIDNGSEALRQGEGRCILAACLSSQEAYALKKGKNSFYTYYLLKGLRKNRKAVDIYGNITPDSLGTYIHDEINNLPPENRPNQKPIRKVEAQGSIIIASYPDLAPIQNIGSHRRAGGAIDLSRWVTIHSAGNDIAGICFTVITAMEASLAWQGKPVLLSARYLYEKARLLDIEDRGIRPSKIEKDEQAGITPGSVIKVIKDHGVPPEEAWRFMPGKRELPEGTTWSELDSKASKFRAQIYPLDTAEDIPKHLQLGRPVLAATRVYENWFYAKNGRVLAPQKDTHMVDETFITIIAYDPKSTNIRFANLWGIDWGDDGFGSMTVNVLKKIAMNMFFSLEVPIKR